MSDAPGLTEPSIRGLFTSQSYDRGWDYYRNGAVSDTEQRGGTLSAEVEGSSYEPYRVTIELDEGGVASAECTCLYDWGGYCKHVAAVLLAYIKKPDEFLQRQSVEALLGDLDRETLLSLLTDLLDQNPHLIDWVEGEIGSRWQREQSVRAPAAEAAEPRQRRAPLDPQPFRRQVRHILRSLDGMRASEAYWHVGGIADQLREIVNQAQPFAQAGDGRNALVILETVASMYVDEWTEFDDSDGELGDFFSELGPAFAEAILSADLSPQERKAWADKLSGWQAEVEEYGIDEGFRVAIDATRLGWDGPLLQRLLRGEAVDDEAWEQADEAWDEPDLAEIYLNVLQWQGRTEEFLRLARETGNDVRYTTMLVRLGRGEEAVEYGLVHLQTADSALSLAQALRDGNLLRPALRVAEHGLSLPGSSAPLARWLRDLALGVKEDALALRAARRAFGASFSLDDYKAVQVLAGAEWPQIKEELLQQLGQAGDEAHFGYAASKIDIYLYEGMVDQAVKTIDQGGYWGHETLEKVVDAALNSHPDWVIRQCKKQAEPIMDQGKSQHYHHALRWLGKARQACLAAGRAAEWRTYILELIDQHQRKYSLRPGLEKLR